jgi:hypothetical protein
MSACAGDVQCQGNSCTIMCMAKACASQVCCSAASCHYSPMSLRNSC